MACRPRGALGPRQRRGAVPPHGLTGPPECATRLAHAVQRLVPLPGGDRCQALGCRASQAHRPCPHARAAADGWFEGFPRPRTQHAQRLCGHRALHAADEAVVQLAWLLRGPRPPCARAPSGPRERSEGARPGCAAPSVTLPTRRRPRHAPDTRRPGGAPSPGALGALSPYGLRPQRCGRPARSPRRGHGPLRPSGAVGWHGGSGRAGGWTGGPRRMRDGAEASDDSAHAWRGASRCTPCPRAVRRGAMRSWPCGRCGAGSCCQTRGGGQGSAS